MNLSKQATNHVLLLLVVASIVTLIVSLTFFHFLFPNDGVYYQAVADNLILFGELRDATVIPSEPLITYQNGIVYFLAALKFIFGKFWWVAYILLVSLLWSVFIARMYYLVSLILRKIYSRKIVLLSIFLTLIPFLHYESITIIANFYNEAIFLPIIWLLFIEYFIYIDEQSSALHLSRKLTDAKVLYGLLIFVLVFGVIFRIQSMIFVLAILSGLFYSNNISWRLLAVSVIPVFEFIILKNSVTAPVSEEIFTAVINHNGFQSRDLLIFPSIMTAPIGLISAWAPNSFLSSSAISYFVMACASMLGVFGLLNMYKSSKALFLTFIILISLNSLFLFLLPISSSRYEHLMTVPVLILYLYGFGSLIKIMPQSYSSKIAPISAVFLGAIFLNYSHNYLFNKDLTHTTYGKIKLYLNASDTLSGSRPFIIYSQEPRFTYWYLARPSCEVSPPECFILQGQIASDRVFFIGQRSSFFTSKELTGYSIGESIKTIRVNDVEEQNDDYGLWKVQKNKQEELNNENRSHNSLL